MYASFAELNIPFSAKHGNDTRANNEKRGDFYTARRRAGATAYKHQHYGKKKTAV